MSFVCVLQRAGSVRRAHFSVCLAACLFLACTPEPAVMDDCRCVGDVPTGRLEIGCGERSCLGGEGYWCVEPNIAVIDPSACAPGSDGGTPTPLVDAGEPWVDPGPPRRGYQDPCTLDAECEAPLHCATRYTLPFCTADCSTDSDCPSYLRCLDGECVPNCELGPRACDPVGGACRIGGSAVCVPACGWSDSDAGRCDEAQRCDHYTGECTTAPAPTGGRAGAPCESPDDCRSGSCLREGPDDAPTGWLGGFCRTLTRSTRDGADGFLVQSGCPPGSLAVSDRPEGRVALCAPSCAASSDCRDGYECRGLSLDWTGVCLPIDCDRSSARECPAGTSCQTTVSGVRRCVRCTPDCDGRSCGDDGCGGSCGACESGETCTGGACECVPETDAELCASAGRDCGSLTATDRCGTRRTIASCGSCTGRERCGAVTAGQCGCVAESDATLCASRGATCGTVSVTDRCGVARTPRCGSCAAPETCGGGGTPNACGVCTPFCGSRECGSDGCGGVCGSCAPTETCRSGSCVAAPCDPVDNTGCVPGERCWWNGSATECIPDGAGSAGDRCSFSDECAAEHECTREGLCREYCRSDSDCASGQCAFELSGSPYGLCSRSCDPLTHAPCDGGLRCVVFATPRVREVTDCRSVGLRSPGRTCTRSEDCQAGYACVGTCERVCRLGTSCSTGPCRSVSGWTTYGVCP